MFDLMQTVHKPTHRCGHILDWILHRRDDEILRTTHVSVLRSLLDKHAPVNNCKVSDKKRAPWYNNIRDTLPAAKMSLRTAERLWRSSGLTVDIEIYDFTKKAVTTIVHNAKCAYYSAKIAETSNTKQLFASLARHS